MLSLQSFNSFSEIDKYAFLEDNGIYLDTYRIDGPYKIALFALPRFYCEVWMNQKEDRLYKAVAFSSYKKLDPFLEKVDISPVYSAF